MDFLLILTTFMILIVVLMMVAIYSVFIKKKSQLILTQKIKEATFEQELANSQVEIKEQTLNYIGQELHDDLGQKLSVARLMTNKLSFSDESEKKEIANEINLLIGECIQDIRNLSKVFITKQVEHFGFVESLEREIFRIKRLQLLEVHYDINNRDLEINSSHALILFRIIQECINNVIKHSKSKCIELLVIDHQDFIDININDTGIGFNTHREDNGSGLKNMISRAKIINTDFKINSSEKDGTKVLITYNK
ncbi:sensor histidine kinase [Kaistella jeonii]|nr:ATP-binding protein [Kaistella jeonii]